MKHFEAEYQAVLALARAFVLAITITVEDADTQTPKLDALIERLGAEVEWMRANEDGYAKNVFDALIPANSWSVLGSSELRWDFGDSGGQRAASRPLKFFF